MLHKKILILATLAAATVATEATAAVIFTNTTYSADTTFTDALDATSMTIAFDGSNYWSASGGDSSGNRYARYGITGNTVTTFAPNIDFRSVFTDANHNVYARGRGSDTIYKQTAPGIFTPYLSLTGGTLNDDSAVVINSNGDFVAMKSGSVSLWDATGTFRSWFTLNGDTGSLPANRGIAVADNYLFTYLDQTLSAWDYNGNLLSQATLAGAGTSLDSYFSLSYTNNRIFIVNGAGQMWRGYSVGLTGTQTVPELSNLALLSIGFTGIAYSRRRIKG